MKPTDTHLTRNLPIKTSPSVHLSQYSVCLSLLLAEMLFLGQLLTTALLLNFVFVEGQVDPRDQGELIDDEVYPDTVTVSSSEGAADNVPHCLGVYKRTSQTWSGRPVWQSTVRDDRFLIYNSIAT